MARYSCTYVGPGEQRVFTEIRRSWWSLPLVTSCCGSLVGFLIALGVYSIGISATITVWGMLAYFTFLLFARGVIVRRALYWSGLIAFSLIGLSILGILLTMSLVTSRIVNVMNWWQGALMLGGVGFTGALLLYGYKRLEFTDDTRKHRIQAVLMVNENEEEEMYEPGVRGGKIIVDLCSETERVEEQESIWCMITAWTSWLYSGRFIHDLELDGCNELDLEANLDTADDPPKGSPVKQHDSPFNTHASSLKTHTSPAKPQVDLVRSGSVSPTSQTRSLAEMDSPELNEMDNPPGGLTKTVSTENGNEHGRVSSSECPLWVKNKTLKHVKAVLYAVEDLCCWVPLAGISGRCVEHMETGEMFAFYPPENPLLSAKERAAQEYRLKIFAPGICDFELAACRCRRGMMLEFVDVAQMLTSDDDPKNTGLSTDDEFGLEKIDEEGEEDSALDERMRTNTNTEGMITHTATQMATHPRKPSDLFLGGINDLELSSDPTVMPTEPKMSEDPRPSVASRISGEVRIASGLSGMLDARREPAESKWESKLATPHKMVFAGDVTPTVVVPQFESVESNSPENYRTPGARSTEQSICNERESIKDREPIELTSFPTLERKKVSHQNLCAFDQVSDSDNSDADSTAGSTTRSPIAASGPFPGKASPLKDGTQSPFSEKRDGKMHSEEVIDYRSMYQFGVGFDASIRLEIERRNVDSVRDEIERWNTMDSKVCETRRQYVGSEDQHGSETAGHKETTGYTVLRKDGFNIGQVDRQESNYDSLNVEQLDRQYVTQLTGSDRRDLAQLTGLPSSLTSVHDDVRDGAAFSGGPAASRGGSKVTAANTMRREDSQTSESSMIMKISARNDNSLSSSSLADACEFHDGPNLRNADNDMTGNAPRSGNSWTSGIGRNLDQMFLRKTDRLDSRPDDASNCGSVVEYKLANDASQLRGASQLSLHDSINDAMSSDNEGSGGARSRKLDSVRSRVCSLKSRAESMKSGMDSVVSKADSRDDWLIAGISKSNDSIQRSDDSIPLRRSNDNVMESPGGSEGFLVTRSKKSTPKLLQTTSAIPNKNISFHHMSFSPEAAHITARRRTSSENLVRSDDNGNEDERLVLFSNVRQTSKCSSKDGESSEGYCNSWGGQISDQNSTPANRLGFGQQVVSQATLQSLLSPMNPRATSSRIFNKTDSVPTLLTPLRGARRRKLSHGSREFRKTDLRRLRSRATPKKPEANEICIRNKSSTDVYAKIFLPNDFVYLFATVDGGLIERYTSKTLELKSGKSFYTLKLYSGTAQRELTYCTVRPGETYTFHDGLL